MRLLKFKDDGELSLMEFSNNSIPPYAILSHTWGLDGDEVTFSDISTCNARSKAGYTKIKFCGDRAANDTLEYFWVDTCCIDKTSSAELQEAITSMFRWYHNAAKCYVYLPDVVTDGHGLDDSTLPLWQLALRESRWFTRGWTLQELIAPRSVEFFSINGTRLGDKQSLEQQLHEITGIAISVLRGKSPSDTSIKDRMSWAEKRNTKCEEDKAYSLLGIFDISMPLIYGEGGQQAMDRLSEQIRKRAKKRNRDEVSQAFSIPTKLLKVSRGQPSSVTSSPALHTEPLSYSVDSARGLDAATISSLINQLYFTKIDERLTSLSAAQGKTCRWFLTKPEYISWNDLAQHPDHDGFLWIKGNPGTGKSTLMKLLFEEAKLNAKSNPLQLTLSFFFLARGTAEEKSTIGLYRSLLHQLEKSVDLRESLEWMTADGARGIERNGWNEEALKQTMVHAIQKLGSRSLMIFVDALDECNTTQTRGMVSFFEELCDNTKGSQVRLQICFSSRHYPTVVIQKGIEVTLEDEIGHREDIEQYIKSKLRLGKSKQAESIRSDILEKSSSIFLWVVLVLDILNSAYPNSSVSIKKIRDRLKEIPPKLTDLFELILTRDGENLEQLQLCLRWILFAARPLKPQELYFAVQIKLDKDCSGYWDQEDVELDQMKTFVRSSSKGLAEVTRNKASEVQFIHESVRDFLLGKYEVQWSKTSGNFVGHSHEILRDCCLVQLNASISKDVDIPDPLPQASGSEGAPLRETIRLKFPFLDYSILNIFHHANTAQQNAIGQGDFLDNFPLERWIFLNNSLEKYDIRQYTKSASLFYILAEKNMADLIQIHPKREFCFDIENERYGLPAFAALASGSDEAVHIMLKVQLEILSLSSPVHSMWKQYCDDGHKWTSFGRDFTFTSRRSIASYLIEYENEILLTIHLQKGDNINLKDKRGRTPLSWAVDLGRTAMTKLLLAREDIDVNSPESNGGRTPLSEAAMKGYEAEVKLLLAREDIDPNLLDKDRWSPLAYATRGGHEAIVKLLLAREDIDVNSKDKNGRTPLFIAVDRGHRAIATLLRAEGGQYILDNGGRTLLSTAHLWEHFIE